MSAHAWSLEVDLSPVSERPGVYLFKGDDGVVLYVGKAANLRARLSSYRRDGGDGRPMIPFLEREARFVETIVTRTEGEALLLEDSLIKTHKPRHNIRLKDDKSFLMIRLDADERFPRLKYVRAHQPKQGAVGRSRLFGPFASSGALRRTLSDLHHVVPLRDCPDTVMNHRSRPCLKHQIGLCSAPCVGLIDEAGYAVLVEKVTRLLSGDTQELERELGERMRAAAEGLEYERAAAWRDRLAALRRTVEGQGVRPRDDRARDVLGLARRGSQAVVHRLAFRERRLAESQSHVFRSELSDEQLLHDVITALYGPHGQRVSVAPDEIVLPCLPAEEALSVAASGGARFFVPKEGERARMLELATENARAELERRDREEKSEADALDDLAKLLQLDGPPEVIDGFDVSNLQGSALVASRVRFRSGHPDRDGYRRFKVRGVEGQDDFASMREVVARSLKRGVAEEDLPDLILIDGGAGQLAAALEAREEAGAWDVAMIGLAKARAERKVGGRKLAKSHERVFLPNVEEPIELAEHSAARHLLERVRDEAHRFAITYHRKERGRIKSQLDSIPGVGPKKRRALIEAFGSVEGVRQASIEDVARIRGIGRELAHIIREHLSAGA
jgi:excinuclease ABC subunit C